MRFTKMQGIGNDYVYVNCFEESVPDPAAAARQLSDRHFGVGSDGLILIRPSERADFWMDMYNADGSRAQMCGNGVRCVAKYVHDRGLTGRTRFTIESGGAIKTVELTLDAAGQTELVTVDMGAPILRPAEIPVRAEGRALCRRPGGGRRAQLAHDRREHGQSPRGDLRGRRGRAGPAGHRAASSSTTRSSPSGRTPSSCRVLPDRQTLQDARLGAGRRGDPRLRHRGLRGAGGRRAQRPV